MNKINENLKKYIYVANLVRLPGYLNFGITEFKALMRYYKINCTIDENYEYCAKSNPFMKFYTHEELNCDVITQFYGRSVLIKCIYRLLSKGKGFENFIKNVEYEKDLSILEDINSNKTFRFYVEGNEYSISKEEQSKIINSLEFLNFIAKVDLKKPERVFYVNYNKNNDEYLFGRLIGNLSNDVKFYVKYDLDKRKYLGPTSLDNKLAFVMCNLAEIGKGSVVYDPFTGTGSLLIPATYFG